MTDIPTRLDNSQLTFKKFVSEFFPGCIIVKNAKSDIEITHKFALAYYKQYLKSGLSFKDYESEMIV